MADTLDPSVIKQTQETLGKFIKKPKLTEKLLTKPPFRFLLDIINVVIKDFGFLKGLYSNDELISDNIKDRDAKIKFLQTLIDVVISATGENVLARPSKIVSGQEADRTNELLQIIGRALINKIDATESINLIKNEKPPVKGKSKVATPTTTTGTNNKIVKPTNKEIKTKISIGNGVNNKQTVSKKPTEKIAKVKEKISNEREPKKSITTKTSNKTIKPEPGRIRVPEVKSSDLNGKNKKDRLLVRNLSSNEISVDNSSQKENESINDNNDKQVEIGEILGPKIERIIEAVTTSPPENNKRKDSLKEEKKILKEIPHELRSSKEQLVDIIDEEAERRRKEKLEKRAAREKQRKSSNENSLIEFMKEDEKLSANKNGIIDVNNDGNEKVVVEELNEKKRSASKRSSITSNQQTPDESNPISNIETTNKKINDVQVKNQPQLPVPPAQTSQPSYIRQKSGDNQQINGRPRTSLRPPSVRPPSARPGAPKLNKNVEIILQPDEMIKLGEINVKIENFNAELEDDGENLIIIEDPATQTDDIFQKSNISMDGDNNIDGNTNLENQQGFLVQQILETQKEFKAIGTGEIKTEIEWDPAAARKRQSSAKQVDILRDSLQKLTRSVNPLGKLLDFLQEDIDSMERELDIWRDNYKQTTIELNREKGLTENSIEPMKHNLAEIESNIKEYIDMIDTSRANILQNDQKIYKLLTEI